MSMSEPSEDDAPETAPGPAGPETGGGALEGALLVAMPGMGDPRFHQTVIYVCAHGEDGAMGLIVNKRAEDLTFADLLKQVGVEDAGAAAVRGVHFGGPVEVGRGFVLHSDDWEAPGVTKALENGLALTATIDILRDMAAGKGPAQAVMALGYAGWAPGQLERELQENGWLTCPADPELIFAADDAGKWAAALRAIGVDPALLSSHGGMA